MKASSRWVLPSEIDELGQFSNVDKHRSFINEIKSSGEKVLEFLGSNPPREGFSNKPLNDALIEAAKDDTEGYPGDTSLFSDLESSISSFIKKYRNINCSTDNLILGPGTAGCWTTIQYAMLEQGDEVLLFDPCHYISGPVKYIDIFKARPVSCRTIEEENWLPDFDDLRKKISNKTKFIVMCNPNNPTSAVWNEQVLKQISDIAGEYNTPIISDEIYGLITYDDIKSTSLFNVSGDVPSIIISGMSKFFMRPGWRIGYMCFNDPDGKIDDVLKTSKKVANMYGHPNKSIPSPILYAAAKAYQEYKGTYEAGKNMIKETQKHRDYILERINEMEGIECFKPQGSLYAFPKILGIGKKWKTDLDFQIQLLKEEKVTWHIGRRYGKYGNGHMRVLMQPTLDRLEDGMNRLSRFMSSHSQ